MLEEEIFMSEKNIDYVPISKLGRGYAGQAIDRMNENDSVIYVLRNNEPTAVIMPFDDYRLYLDLLKSNERINKKEASARLAGSLKQFSDPSKVEGEKEYYRRGLNGKYGK
jgi:PHD/YefM family antitoxin component YafN of YafNO toxin-antitoxin module